MLVVGEHDQNVAVKLVFPAEVDVVPLEDHPLILNEVDIDHLLLHHYIIIEFINLRPIYRRSPTPHPCAPKAQTDQHRENGSGALVKCSILLPWAEF